MAFPRGRPRPPGSGRKPGTPNRSTRTAAEIQARFKFDAIECLIKIAQGQIPCSVCLGAGKTLYQPARGKDKLSERTCESCYGRGLEIIGPELKLKAAAELAKYAHPQLKAIEHTGAGGGPVEVVEILQRRLGKLNAQV